MSETADIPDDTFAQATDDTPPPMEEEEQEDVDTDQSNETTKTFVLPERDRKRVEELYLQLGTDRLEGHRSKEHRRIIARIALIYRTYCRINFPQEFKQRTGCSKNQAQKYILREKIESLSDEEKNALAKLRPSAETIALLKRHSPIHNQEIKAGIIAYIRLLRKGGGDYLSEFKTFTEETTMRNMKIWTWEKLFTSQTTEELAPTAFVVQPVSTEARGEEPSLPPDENSDPAESAPTQVPDVQSAAPQAREVVPNTTLEQEMVSKLLQQTDDAFHALFQNLTPLQRAIASGLAKGNLQTLEHVRAVIAAMQPSTLQETPGKNDETSSPTVHFEFPDGTNMKVDKGSTHNVAVVMGAGREENTKE